MAANSPTLLMPLKAAYRPNLFDPSAFSSVEAIDDVLSEFEQVVREDNYERVLRGVVDNEQAHVLPLVVSRELC